MNKRNLVLALLTLMVPVLLTACGGGVDEGELEDALRKFYADGDVNDLNELVCDDDRFEDNSSAVGVQVNDIDCSIDDKDVECNVTATVEQETLEVIVTATIDDDDKVCSLAFSEPDFSEPE